MKKLSYPLLALLFALTLTVQARDTAPVVPETQATLFYFHFDFVPKTADLKALEALLPKPPAEGSPTTRQEIDFILDKQKTRTPEEEARIKKEQRSLDVYLFENALGTWFTKKNLPVTDALFRRVGAIAGTVVERAKENWDRRRPFQQDKRIQPPLSAEELADLSKNCSYPSGHSTAGCLDALILFKLAPDHKDALMACGLQIGDDRVLGGVHFPSDVDAGHTLAHYLFDKLMAIPEFQSDLAKAKAEVGAARGAAGKP